MTCSCGDVASCRVMTGELSFAGGAPHVVEGTKGTEVACDAHSEDYMALWSDLYGFAFCEPLERCQS